MARIAAGTVALHDARRKRRWSVELEAFEIGVFPVTQEQLATIEQQLIQPELAADDWLGAVDAAATGLADAAGGGSGAGSTGGTDSATSARSSSACSNSTSTSRPRHQKSVA